MFQFYVGMEMESMIDKPGKNDLDPDYKEGTSSRFPKRWWLLLIVLVLIAVIVGGIVGILKAIQSSGSSGRYLLNELRLIS